MLNSPSSPCVPNREWNRATEPWPSSLLASRNPSSASWKIIDLPTSMSPPAATAHPWPSLLMIDPFWMPFTGTSMPPGMYVIIHICCFLLVENWFSGALLRRVRIHRHVVVAVTQVLLALSGVAGVADALRHHTPAMVLPEMDANAAG